MPRESILIDGKLYETLQELLRPGLRAVFVGITPAPASVESGHYYQGPQGRRLWKRLQDFGVVRSLEKGREDESAFQQGFGFAVMVRKPSTPTKYLPKNEIREGARLLVQRLVGLGEPRPIVVFVYVMATHACETGLREAGFETIRMSGSYAKREVANRMMREIAEKLKRW